MGKNIEVKVKTRKTFEEWFKEVDKAISNIMFVGDFALLPLPIKLQTTLS